MNQPNEIMISSVSDKPEVEVTSTAFEFIQGNKMTLTCDVKRSNPQPHTYVWRLNETDIRQGETQQYVVERIQPEDRGFYTCSATNTVGTGTSPQIEIEVQCKFHSSLCCMYVSYMRVGDDREKEINPQTASP